MQTILSGIKSLFLLVIKKPPKFNFGGFFVIFITTQTPHSTPLSPLRVFLCFYRN